MAQEVIKQSVKTWSLFATLLVTFLASASAAEEGDAFLLFPYRLVTSSYFGKISEEALPGSHIPVDDTLPSSYHMQEKEYIKLGLIRKEDYHPAAHANIPNNHSDSILLALPPGISWYVSEVEGEMEEGKGEEIAKEGGGGEGGGEGQVDKNIFTVGGDFFLSVRNPHSLAVFSEVEFWVVARSHDVAAASNPVSFIVKIEHKDKESGSTLYVGIVVLVICMFALLIPITVRTKRRLRENRSICACGSSQDKSDGQGVEVGTGSGSRDAQRDSLAASLYGSRGSMESDPHRHETFQHHMLRSDSDHHFQPRWLDPHFRHEYEHPQYKAKAQSPLERVRQSSMGSSSSTRSERVVGKY